MNKALIEEIKSIAEEYNIKVIFKNGKLTKKSREHFINWINWCHISRYKKLPKEFIREFADNISWHDISYYHTNLSEGFIREFSDKVKWVGISYYQNLSEEFIREFSDKVDWYWISECQKLSEEFIREFANKVDWCGISYCQELSEGFIKEYYDKINFKDLLQNKHIAPKIKEKLKLLQRIIQS